MQKRFVTAALVLGTYGTAELLHACELWETGVRRTGLISSTTKILCCASLTGSEAPPRLARVLRHALGVSVPCPPIEQGGCSKLPYAGDKFVAAGFPRSIATSYLIFCPSVRLPILARSTAEI